ncbi:MAG: bifunctional (p)ppGpp synthetase/guanosine-3',5'-bis(diphosphate) 3'-pyrophosphohydrolase, partial [Deltaproteobacteria bacterium]|nr:bifunctional (p)ppGpp synthetase/guanosine-3',5'-bis(diphosphate) 3'-pyrophosphohydrolase [Deltaproteobacteria bacterium]
LIRRAYVYAAKVHAGQVRLSGEPYLAHPLEVAGILTKMRLDVASVAAGFLHDSVEDTRATTAAIRELFGQEVGRIVAGVTKISVLGFDSQQAAQAENIRKMILAMADDIRVLLVKLADRLHNMRTLGFQPPSKQTRIARETLDIYAPLAGRLGIYWMKSELEDLCLYTLEPEDYRRIADGVAQRANERAAYISQVSEILSHQLEEHGIKARLQGRPKHYYSIYKKMNEQQIGIDQLFDITGFRIIVGDERECYEALGLVHALWKPIPGRFKDYINLVKANRYQSLHTAVIGPEGARVEVQIRTEEMHQVAEEGIAAHWRYKEGGGALDEAEGERFAWLRQLMEWQRELSDPREFLDSVRVELYADEVYVFTPQGQVKVLPKGATTIDFAYAIHSEVGDHCSGAKVNGRMVPLKTVLNNGDVVEIITEKKTHPSKDRLGFAVTSKARQKIRHWINTEEKARSEAIGRDLLDKELRKQGASLASVLKSEELGKALEDFNLRGVDDLVLAVGYGRLTPKQVVHRIFPQEAADHRAGLLDRMVKKIRHRPKEMIRVKGVDDIMFRFAKCCSPLPGDEIVGYITHGRGVSVHLADCPNIKDVLSARLVEVEWETDEEASLPVKLAVTAHDQAGVLGDVANVFSGHEVNITEAHVQATGGDQTQIDLTAMVKNRQQLDRIVTDLKKLKTVQRVVRVGA